jgi:L-threonylcarbamoyladenylate synthase
VAEIIPADAHAADLAVRVMRAGELIAYPTDTVYGLGAPASDDNAVRKLFAVKGRQLSKPLPLLIADSMMAAWVAEVTPVAHTLAAKFWPGPLTIVMRKQPEFRSIALAKLETVALRVPAYDLVRDIIRGLGEPMTGTSANRSGSRPPVSASEVAFQLGEMIALVIDGGRTAGGIESTVIDVSQDGGPTLVREGPVSREELERVLGRGLVDSG